MTPDNICDVYEIGNKGRRRGGIACSLLLMMVRRAGILRCKIPRFLSLI